jgi:hypothetical protein
LARSTVAAVRLTCHGGLRSLGSDLPEPLGNQKAGRYNFIAPDECRSEKVGRLLGYWNEIRVARPMPRRQDIDPTMIWNLLKNISLSEWHLKPDRLFYRIAGTEVVSALGIELRGKWLSEVYPDSEDVERTLSLYRRVVATRAPVLGRTDGTQMRLGVNSYEWVICPLSDDAERVTHFVVLEDYVARRPYLGAPS